MKACDSRHAIFCENFPCIIRFITTHINCDLKHYCTYLRLGVNNRSSFLREPERFKISRVPPINNEFLFLNSMYRKITYFGTVKICSFSTRLNLNTTLKYARKHKSCEHGGIFNLREFTNEFVRFHGVT